ncbi:hypothetical protein ACWE42_11215 [Sutcliffiella cohnii]
MKKWFSITILMVLLILIFVLINSKSDYNGKIGEITEEYLVLYGLKLDPEADQSAPIIYFNIDTQVIGKGTAITDLKIGQEIKVWASRREDNIIANKIKIVREN